MATMEWNAAHDAVGVDVIDHQHQHMFGLIEALLDSLGGGSRVDIFARLIELSQFVRRHFKYEEAYLKRGGLNGDALREHRTAHILYLGYIRQCVREFSAGLELKEQDLKDFFTRWTRMHIQDRDKVDLEAVASA
jgi:hemerythrin-like metal-binding protein